MEKSEYLICPKTHGMCDGNVSGCLHKIPHKRIQGCYEGYCNGERITCVEMTIQEVAVWRLTK